MVASSISKSVRRPNRSPMEHQIIGRYRWQFRPDVGLCQAKVNGQ